MNNIWVTFADKEIYLKSAYALALSLQKVQSKYSLCIMIPIEQVESKEYQEFAENAPSNVIIKEVPYLYFNFLNKYWQNVTVNKFHAFTLTEYNKFCFLDADSYITQNIDYLFELDTPIIGYYTNDKNEFCVSTGIFLMQPSLTFYSLLLNLCISLEFFDDENIFYYLSQENNILQFSSYLNDIMPNYKDIILQEQKREKFWSQYSYKEILNLINTNGQNLLEQYIKS